MRLARRFEHLALSIFVVFTQASCFKKLGEDRKPDPTGDNSFTAFYMGRDSSFIAATAKCQADSTVQFRYSSDRYGERHDVNEECPESGTLETKLRVPKGDVNQLISIQVRSRIKNILSVADEETLRWSPNVTGFAVTGITGVDDSNSDVWLVKSNRVPKVNFSNSQDATGYKLSIKDAAGATEICPEVTLDASASSHEFTGCTLDPATQYQAVLTAVNSNIETNAAAYTFTVDDTVPTAGNIDGVTGVSDLTLDACLGEGLNPTINWSGFTNANDYLVTIKQGLSTICSDTTFDQFLTACSLEDGDTYTAYVTARSASTFNTVTSAGFIFTVDATPPSAPAVGLNGLSPTNEKRPQFIWFPIGGNYRYKLDDNDWVDTNVVSFTPASDLSEGPHTFSVQIKDACGNWSPTGSDIAYIDLTKPNSPSVTTSGPNPTTNLRPEWTWTSGGSGVLQGSGYYEVYIDGVKVTEGNITNYIPGSDLTLGSHLAEIREKDIAGNWSDFGSYTIVINPSGNPCVPFVSSPGTVSTARPTWTWVPDHTGTCTGANTYRVSIDDQVSWQIVNGDVSFTPGVDLAEGYHFLYVQEGDGVTWSPSGGNSVLIDLTPPPPVATWLNPSKDVEIPLSYFQFAWQTPTIEYVNYFVRGFTNGNCSGAPAVTATVGQYDGYLYTGLVNGQSYSLEVYSQDIAGNRSAASPCSASVTVNTALTKVVTKVSLGSMHGCAIVSNEVYCWGGNNQLQVGSIFAGRVAAPTIVTGTTGATDVATAMYSSYAAVNGGVKSWGYGALGRTNGMLIDWVSTLGSGSGVTQVDGGNDHVCAVVSGGVKCWGSNDYGKLGASPTGESPVTVSGLGAGSGVTEVKAGMTHTCALVNGGVKCWGQNNKGQLGNNSTTDSSTPVNVTGLGAGSGVVSIEAADNISCAVLNTGALKCWGMVVYNSSEVSHTTPFLYPGFETNTTSVSGAFETGCAIKNGSAYCIGLNTTGQGGFNCGATICTTATHVAGIPAGNISQIIAGHVTSCAIVTGALLCWGSPIGLGYNVDANSLLDTFSPVVMKWDAAPETIYLADNFDRANNSSIGNGWTESNVAGSNASIVNGALTLDSNGSSFTPILKHAIALPDMADVHVSFDFNFVRTGLDTGYAVYIQIGDGAQMVNGDYKTGVAINLKWAGTSTTQNIGGMTAHQGFGWERSTTTQQVAATAGSVRINLSLETGNNLNGGNYRFTVNDVRSGWVQFENNFLPLTQIRIFTNSLGSADYSSRTIDNLKIWKFD